MSAQYSTDVTVADKSAVIIGGTSGIGRAIALAYAEDGADVIATSRDRKRTERITEELRERDSETTAITTDVREHESLTKLRDVALDIFGEVDILINSAGSVARAAVTEMLDEQWERDIDVCLTGVFRAIQTFSQSMNDGSIINISSMSAWQARKLRPAYCSAKSGVNGLTRASAADLGPDIRVNAIAPGFIQTPITNGAYDDGTEKRMQIDDRTPSERVGQPEEIAGAAIYLGSDAASFTTGEVITIDGGYHDSAL